MRPFYKSSDQYWNKMHGIKARRGAYPANVFDFISIHSDNSGHYRLLAPLCLTTPSKRPRFERLTFSNYGLAMKRATDIAAACQLHVVCCINPGKAVTA